MTITKRRITTTSNHTIELNGDDLIKLINGDKPNISNDIIPDDADVEFYIPGGGDWSHTSVEISNEHPICITWTTTSEVDYDE